jgi:hypothetical protein
VRLCRHSTSLNDFVDILIIKNENLARHERRDRRTEEHYRKLYPESEIFHSTRLIHVVLSSLRLHVLVEAKLVGGTLLIPPPSLACSANSLC